MQFCPRDGARLAAASETEAQLAWALAHRFRIVRRLGAGGMGTVFLAEQIAVGNRPVALKVLNRKLLDDPEFLLRFQNEAASTGRIRHPNVVTIYESGQADDGTPYIAMEYLEGETLSHALKTRGALPVAECAEILQQAARGLNAAHKLGIIHRDLKPDNIFLTYCEDVGAPLVGALAVARADTGRAQEPALNAVKGPPLPVVVKIVDFGIAKLRESATHTLAGTVLGTPAYMSYEQASGMKSDELDARSDIYSLGIVAYEMLTGRLPFQSDTPVGYLRKHLQDAPPPFRAVNPDLPALPEVESVVMKALTKDREQRYGSVLEFAGAFTQVAQPSAGTRGPGPLASTVTASPPATAKPPRFRTTPKSPSKTNFAVLGGLTLVIMFAGVWYFSRHAAKVGGISSGGKAAESKGQAKANANKTTFSEKGIEGWVNPKDGLTYVWIPPGRFRMGCSPGDTECFDGEKPPHQVTITRGFWLGQTEVTVGAYKRFAGGTGKAMPTAPDFSPGWANEQMPIVNLNWGDARAYCAWVGGRLPTEAEWEYAARGGSAEARYGPADEVAWHTKNSGGQAHVVGKKRANGFGLYDMLGNVWEWVSDWYGQNYYQNSPSQDPAGPTNGTLHAVRGGSWISVPGDIRVSARSMGLPEGDITGFRCVRELSAP
jgi:serine/threonine-protein kinase